MYKEPKLLRYLPEVLLGGTAFLVLTLLFGARAESDLNSGSLVASKLAPSALETRAARIGSIRIDNRNIFDPANPAEDRWLYRVANSLHVKTRPQVIESQLLFAEGDLYSEQVAKESERILRGNRYIADAKIEPVQYEDGVVDLNVKTVDVWTLSLDASFGRQGGVNSGGFGLREMNLLGTGTYVAAKYRSTVDRDNAVLEIARQHLFDSHFGASTSLSR